MSYVAQVIGPSHLRTMAMSSLHTHTSSEILPSSPGKHGTGEDVHSGPHPEAA